jgi:ADP-L-glycero-D-manno-heptose 6-epimerase
VIIVTGGAGFIGSCIVARLNAEGHKDIIIVDHVPEGDRKKENLTHKNYVNFYDKDEFLALVQKNQLDYKVEAFIHMGAWSATTGQDAAYYEKNNFQYSCHVAKWALAHNARFIYASSAATYGDGRFGYSDDHKNIPQLKPLNLYGESKQKFDHWILDNGYADKVVGLKFFNVFGPNEYHKADMRSVIAKSYERVLKEGKIALFKSYKKEYADGEQKRDFIYVKDAVDVVMYFLKHPKVNGIYNVGTGQARSWNDLAKALFVAAGKPLNIEYVDMPPNLKDKYQYITQADMAKLRQAGYTKPFTSLEEAVKDYAKYLKTNAKW